jgi:uncharacterized protein with LGFP repeats
MIAPAAGRCPQSERRDEPLDASQSRADASAGRSGRPTEEEHLRRQRSASTAHPPMGAVISLIASGGYSTAKST